MKLYRYISLFGNICSLSYVKNLCLSVNLKVDLDPLKGFSYKICLSLFSDYVKLLKRTGLIFFFWRKNRSNLKKMFIYKVNYMLAFFLTNYMLALNLRFRKYNISFWDEILPNLFLVWIFVLITMWIKTKSLAIQVKYILTFLVSW